MNKLTGATAFAVAFGFAVVAMAASEADSKVKWDKADVNKNGTSEGKVASTYLDAMTKRG